MLMLGKMSVGVRAIVSGPTMRMSRARTTNVYGRRSAIRTIHIGQLILTHGPEATLQRLVTRGQDTVASAVAAPRQQKGHEGHKGRAVRRGGPPRGPTGVAESHRAHEH